MKLIKQSFQILDPTGYTINDIYKSIELAGRTCYLSYDKITEDSAKKFIDMIIKLGHLSVLEHGTIYLTIVLPRKSWKRDVINKYYKNKYSVVVSNSDEYDDYYYITTNYRVIIENKWADDLVFLCSPTQFHKKRISVKFILPISISRNFVRHRCMSFSEQSTRYCNFNSDKFNNEISFIIPYWANLVEDSYKYWDGDWVNNPKNSTPDKILKPFEYNRTDTFLLHCDEAEVCYKTLIDQGCKPQEAREVLPLCTKTELIMTGTIDQWKNFFKLRCDKAAHPQAQELANGLKKEFIKRKYIYEFE